MWTVPMDLKDIKYDYSAVYDSVIYILYIPPHLQLMMQEISSYLRKKYN